MATYKTTITAGTTGPWNGAVNIGTTITAVPGSGGTMTVQYSTSTEADLTAGTATWINWPSGSVSSATSDTLLGHVSAIRASATTADGVLEVRNQ